MAFREVDVIEVREVLRGWLAGGGLRTAAERAGVDRKTARRYLQAAEAAGLIRKLSPGNVVTARAIAGDTAIAVAIARPGPGRPVELLALSPAADTVTTLLSADSIDITELCWPLVPRSGQADSYAAQILTRNSSLEQYWNDGEEVRPLAPGMTEVPPGSTGPWPQHPP